MKQNHSISPNLMKNILDDCNSAIFSIDRNLNIIYFNKKASSICGKNLSDCKNKNIFEEVSLFSNIQIKNAILDINENNSTESLVELNNKNIKINATEESINIWLEENFSTSKKINLSSAFEGLNDAVWEWTEDKVYLSPKWKKMLGYKNDELSDEISTWIKLTHPNDKKKTIELFENYINRKVDYFETEFRLKHKNGNWVHILSRCFAIDYNSDGIITQVLGVNTDVSQHRKNMQDLEDSQSFLDLIYKHSNVGLAIGDELGNITLSNPALCKMIGYTKEELFGKNFGEITYDEDLPKEANYVEQIMKGEINSYQIEKRYVKKNGDLIWVRANIATVKTHSNEIINFVGVIDDITEKKKMKNY